VALGSTDFSTPQERVLVGNFSIDTSLQTVQVASDSDTFGGREWAILRKVANEKAAEVDRLRAEVERLTRERDEAREAACLRTGHVATGARATISRLAAALRDIEGIPVSWDKTELLQAFAAIKGLARAALAEVDK
jgi:hypothetical protein